MYTGFLRIILLSVVFLVPASRLFSQDIIVRTNNDSIKAKVVEISKDKIKFRYRGVKDGTTLEIHKNEVKQIIYENGSKLTIVYNRYEVPSEMIIRERSHAIKVDVFSPLLNHFTIGYEMKLKLGMNLDIKASLIATNIATFLDFAEGYFFKGGIKFISLSNSYSKGLKYVHPMKGSYFKPEFIFGQFTRTEDHQPVKYTNYVIDIVFGRQYMLNKVIALDYYGGVGFGIQNSSTENDFTYAYSHVFFGKTIPIIITGGLTLGFVF
jgi:sRNA-binding carbon storage regulator CsrA